MGLVVRALRIDAGEGRTTAFVVALMFGSMAGLAVGESAIQAMFLARFGTDPLPLMYLAQAGTTLVAMFGLTAVLDRVDHRLVYVASPAGLAAVLLVERAIVLTDAGWIYPVLWVTVAFAMLAQAIGLWGIAGSVTDTRQAKRLFPIFGAGGILGAVVGGLLTRPLAGAVGTPNLLLVWAGLLVGASVLCRLTLGPGARLRRSSGRRPTSLFRDLRRNLAMVRRSRLLVAMAASAVLFSVLFFSLFLPFATAASERFPDPDELAGVLGVIGAIVTGAAFLVSMFATNRLFARFGVAAMVLVLPLLYVGAFATLLVVSGFAAIVSLRIVTGVWLQGVASPAWEALVNIVPDERRDQTRAFLNGGPAQVGTAIAGLVALVGQDVLSPRQFAAIGLVASLLTLATALRIRRAYTGALVEAMHAGRPQVFEKAAPWTPMPLALDAESGEVLARSMRSADVRERRLAFELADGRSIPTTELPHGVADPDPTVRLVAVRAIDVSDPHGREAVRPLIDDEDAAVAAAAAAKELAVSDTDHAMARLDALLHDPVASVRRAALEQVRLAPDGLAADLASGLLDDPAPEVRAAALIALAASPDRALGPAVAALEDPDPSVRIAAGRTLGAVGPAAVEPVLAALADPRTAEPGAEAARRLRATGREDAIHDAVRPRAREVAEDVALARSIPTDGDAEELLRAAVLERARRVARSALWAETMVASQPDAMATAIDNLDAGPAQVSDALETLEIAGGRATVRPLLAPWEPIRPHRDDGWLDRALEGDATVRRCAELIRSRRGGPPMEGSTTAPLIERVLVLRQVPLFADLGPSDLELVAEVAEERGYVDGETIAAEGELGDELHVVTHGTIRVVREADDRELARRTTGEVVGEMSMLTRTPRVASLVADGTVRTLRIGYREFESMLRERPAVALSLMRVLATRLAESSSSPDA